MYLYSKWTVWAIQALFSYYKRWKKSWKDNHLERQCWVFGWHGWCALIYGDINCWIWLQDLGDWGLGSRLVSGQRKQRIANVIQEPGERLISKAVHWITVQHTVINFCNLTRCSKWGFSVGKLGKDMRKTSFRRLNIIATVSRWWCCITFPDVFQLGI